MNAEPGVHRVCPRCGGPMELTGHLQDGALRWLWVCKACRHQIRVPTHPGRPQPFPEREDEQGG